MTVAPRSRRRTVLIGVAIAVVVAAVYATVVGLYAGSGGVSAGGGATDDDAIVLTLTPEKMDASANRLSVSVLPGQDGGVHTDGFVVDKPFGVLVSAVAGSRAIEYTKDSLLAPAEVSIVTDGAIEEWPFDRYTVTTIVVAAEDVADETVPLPTRIQGAGRVPGWDVSMQGRDVGDGLVAVDVTVSRSGSTVAFGMVLLSLMIVIPVLVLIVAIQVFRGRRKVEVTALGWMGAMLFATIPLRNFLPGSPPIGSWIDYLVVLWVLAALVAGLVVFVAAWLRRGPAA